MNVFLLTKKKSMSLLRLGINRTRVNINGFLQIIIDDSLQVGVMYIFYKLTQQPLGQGGWIIKPYKSTFRTIFIIYMSLLISIQISMMGGIFCKQRRLARHSALPIKCTENAAFATWIISVFFQAQHITYLFLGGIFTYQRTINALHQGRHQFIRDTGNAFMWCKLIRFVLQLIMVIPFFVIICFNSVEHIQPQSTSPAPPHDGTGNATGSANSSLASEAPSPLDAQSYDYLLRPNTYEKWFFGLFSLSLVVHPFVLINWTRINSSNA
jgi:hypothetical protein